MSEYPAWPGCSSRMGHLLTEFPANTELINKISYNEKLSFWKNRLDSSLRSTKTIFFNLDDLRENDKYKMKYKNELDKTNTVHIIKRQILETVLSNFSNDYQDDYSFNRKTEAVISNYSNTWSFWAGDKLKSAVFGGSKSDFVSVKELNNIVDILTPFFGETLDRELLNLKLEMSYRKISDSEMNALLAHLKQNNLLSHDEEFKVFIIRNLQKNEENTTKLSESKLAVFQLEKTLSSIKLKIDRETTKINGLKTEAKKFLNDKNKTRALTIFKKAKIGEQNLDKLYNQLDNIQGLLDGIQNAQSDKEILESLKAGVVGLKMVTGAVSVDEVENVMDELDDVLGDQVEIQNAMGRSVIEKDGFDDFELEDELNEILEKESEIVGEIVGEIDEKSDSEVRINTEIPKIPEVPGSAINELDLIMDEIQALKINKENTDEVNRKNQSKNQSFVNNGTNQNKPVLTS